jgi:cell division septation protein DedD
MREAPVMRQTAVHPALPSEMRIQVGAYEFADNARDAVARLESAGFKPYTEKYGSLTRVLVSAPLREVPSARKRLSDAGFKDLWVKD